MDKLGIFFVISLYITFSYLITDSALAHSGRTNSYGCHNDYVNGGYHCHNGGYEDDDDSYIPRTCTFNGVTYNSTGSAYLEYGAALRTVVDRVYLKDLNRKATNDDYDYWLNKLNAKTLDQKLSCKWSGFSDSLIHNEVVLSVEYANWQKLNNHRASIRKVYTEILGRNSTNEEVANWEKEPDIERIKTFLKNTDEYKKRNDWLGFYINKYGWWIIGITAYLIYVLYQYIREHRRTKHS